MSKFPTILLAVFLVAAGTSQAENQKPVPPPEKPPAAHTAPPPASPAEAEETLWQKLLRVSGISANPSTLKGPGDDLAGGELWSVELEAGTPRQVIAGAGYRSPIFEPGGDSLLALAGDRLVRISLAEGEPRALRQTSAIKLVGFVAGEPDRVLLVTRDEAGRPVAAFLSLGSGETEVLTLDRDSEDGRRMLHHLQGWQRSYSTAKLYTRRETRRDLIGTVEWTDVVVKRGAGDPVNVSRCGGTNCGQPSLSPDGRRVVFVKSAR